jgi:hypothetical protein
MSQYAMVPAHAGVNRTSPRSVPRRRHGPRARGGEPSEPERAASYPRAAMAGAWPRGTVSEIDRLILEAALGARRLARSELQRVLAHVAQAGFDPTPDRWGRTSAEKHFHKHVERRQEWPEGTTLETYVASARQVVLDPQSAVFTSRYQGHWQLGVVRRSGELRGPRGHDWVVVEYRVASGTGSPCFSRGTWRAAFSGVPDARRCDGRGNHPEIGYRSGSGNSAP